MNDEFSEFFVASLVGLAGWLFGGLDGFVKVLLAFTSIDYITGLLRAGSEHRISSAIAFKGIARKVAMFFLVAVAHLIDQMLGNSEAFKVAVCLFYIGNEGISIIENAEKLGVKIPDFLHGKFLSFTEENTRTEAENEKHLNGLKNN